MNEILNETIQLNNERLIQRHFEDLDLGEYGEDLIQERDNGYISDCIQEEADNFVDIYDSELLNWLSSDGNSYYLDEAIDEFGWDGCGKTLMRAIQMAQFLKNERDMYDHIDDIVCGYAFKYLENVADIELDDDFMKSLIWELERIDQNNTVDDIYDIVNEELRITKESIEEYEETVKETEER